MVDLDHPEMDWELLRSADRAVHRLRHAERRRSREVAGGDGTSVRLGRLHASHGSCAEVGGSLLPGSTDGGEEFGVLVRAMSEGVIDRAEAELIARSRLAG
ncbi:hypothetical protein M2271_001273 [Streptomyces sp. LBL]|uniref:hypothetical protein n=1 Tax=Streptomyces sp. LBL TaxID=2940562 RepID=UPI00247496DB|nr:hypothetical protein [Streptomyces sp. LBL]MDH6623486.1 hypothetical protein [Streptomyces sp. LBL]